MVSAAGPVKGVLQTEGVTGGKAQPHGWVEQKVYVGRGTPAADDSERIFGAGGMTAAQPPGAFSIAPPEEKGPFAAGPGRVFSLCYDGTLPFFFGDVLRLAAADEPVKAGELVTPAHYSVMYATKWEEWGQKPWLWGADFYQTFTATGPHVTRIATKLAGKSGDHFHLTLNYAIYSTTDGPPSEWKQISPTRSVFLSEGTDPIIHIHWVPFQSQEVTLEPGKRYAARFWRNEVSQSDTFAMVTRPDSGDGYREGHLWADGKERKDLDVYAFVSGGDNGTVVNHAPVGSFKLDKLVGTAKRHGQTFKATGVGLAGVDMIYATGAANPPQLPVTFQLYDKPGGKPIGPPRTCVAISLAFQGRAAALWAPNEAPLKPGQMYYLEWTSPGFNIWRVNEDLPGEAYVDGKRLADADLAMSIAEYASRPKK
jgi:hypothetical protein